MNGEEALTPEDRAAQIWAPIEERHLEEIREDIRAEKRRPKYFPDIMMEARDREEFRKSAILQLPGQQDPYLRNAHKEARTLFDQRIDGLRQHIFRGLPRGVTLTAEQQDHFSRQAYRLYQICFGEAQGNVETAKEALGNLMSRFDRMAEERKAEEKAAAEARAKVAKPTFFEKEVFKEELKRRAEERKEKIWIHHPKLKRKLQISPSALPQWQKKGYVRGRPYGIEKVEPGKLSEASVLKQFDNLSLDLGKPELKNRLYQRYRNLRRTEKLSREDAYSRTVTEFQENVYEGKHYDTIRVLPGKGTWGREEDGSWTRIK